jgi:outer membrane protein OmpA-like peptidoglycan-associated protein
MNNTFLSPIRSLLAVAVAATLFAGCAAAPTKPAGSAEVRAKLTALQREPTLANRAPVAFKDAETAVAQAELIEKDLVLAAHRVYIADRKVDTARHLAETRFAEEERTALNEQSEKARLDSRTREADLAKSDAMIARADSDAQRAAADSARSDAEELKRQLEILQAQPTDRGLVLTLGDTLFATGRSELKSGATANLDRVTTFLNEYPKRTAAIEGYTDSVGSEEMNQSLSQRRADAVKNYLVRQGVGSARLTSEGRGEDAPVADNESAAGRQQNRRVEVVISPIESN